MPRFNCHCGAGFFLPHQKTKQLIGYPYFCSPGCLYQFIVNVNHQCPIHVVASPLMRSEPEDGYWSDLLHMWFRSEYEEVMALWLWHKEIPARYERLGIPIEKKIYTPDFYLNQHRMFIEVKGPWRWGGKRKVVKALKANYPVHVVPEYLIRELRTEVHGEIHRREIIEDTRED